MPLPVFWSHLRAHARSNAPRVVLGLVTAVVMAGEGGARAQGASAIPTHIRPQYSIRDLSTVAPAGLRLNPVSMNDRGDVAGSMQGSGGPVSAFIYRHGRIINIGAPSGRAVKLLGVDNRDTVLVQATAQEQPTLYFTADTRRKNRRWVRLHSGVPGYKVAAASQIAMNGDVVGTLRSLRSSRRVAAIWLPRPTGQYARATMLLPSPTYHESDGIAVWARSTKPIVAGVSFKPHGGDGLTTLWSSPRGVGFTSTATYSGPVISEIGGWGRHVYVCGASGGYDYSFAWRGSIIFPRHGAANWIVGPTLPTPGPAGLFSVAHSVSADSRGRFLAVGGEQAGGGNESIALIWRGNSATNLNDLVKPDLGWHLVDADAINLRGDIVGTGSIRGTYSAFVLTPNAKS